MITVHLNGILLDSSPRRESYSFEFDGKNDSEIDLSIINRFNQMVSDGFVNVNCVNEDSQVDVEDTHLRFSHPYIYVGNTIVDLYIPDYSPDEISDMYSD